MQTFERIAKVVTTSNREDLVQSVTGVNTEACFIHMKPKQAICTVSYVSRSDKVEDLTGFNEFNLLRLRQ